ncbi:bifunctional copper resistance protein CopD/cytochrome c oxidase assembly protein [Spiractinospora alimapuensis]|uniref:cytochrome c oxidase assembly protein n=1 Tax=Spiractinospora alimapuensis TaxID=2820884 RepID=UPI001F1A76DA|nr:cytochrome c oxidase assembly protein [Spiractinospora alimapuensis]QVQ53314.1 bifunctional copper resistance protein CopD/cytochrome c oxidase assembly protein [Spiractinospora alimapuensis]
MASLSTSDGSQTEERPTGPRRRGVVVAVAAGVACLAGLIGALFAGGVATAPLVPGLPDAGMLTRWGLPVTKTALNIAAALTLGLLLLAVVMLPLNKGALSPRAVGYVRAASWCAIVWAVAGGATLVFQLSDVLGLPPSEVIGDQLTSYAGSTSQGIALMVVVLVATAVALLARTVESPGGALGLVALSVVGLLPPPLTGHSASSPNHEMAITGVALHVVAITVWIGGLAALCWHATQWDRKTGPIAANRFSAIALWAYIGVGVSGVATTIANLPTLGDLFAASDGFVNQAVLVELLNSPYVHLIIVKIVLFGVLGYLGWLHRSSVLPRLAEGGRRAFARLAGGEIILMGTVLGISVALSRTSPPEYDLPYDPARELLGFEMPPPMSAETLLTLWRPDLFYFLLVLVLGGLYAAAVVRLRRRGDHWSWGRTAAWFLGLLSIVAVKLTGVGTYAMVLFSVHMMQHMVLSMLTPILLVLGGPATLALRALHPAKIRGDRGPREWLTLLLNSKLAHFMTHPGVVVPLFVVSTYALYFTPLFGTLMLSMAGHMFMSLHFIIVGYLFYWILIGVDPLPRSMPHPLRVLLLLLTMGLHAFFGIGIMSIGEPIAMQWYGAFEVPWLLSEGVSYSEAVLEDQQTGGGIAWAMGEIPTVLCLFAVLYQWIRDDERVERRRQRHSRRGGSDDADLDAYNDYLARLDRRARGQAPTPAADSSSREPVAESGAAGGSGDGNHGDGDT